MIVKRKKLHSLSFTKVCNKKTLIEQVIIKLGAIHFAKHLGKYLTDYAVPYVPDTAFSL